MEFNKRNKYRRHIADNGPQIPANGWKRVGWVTPGCGQSTWQIL